jgi:AcrR family transcriptional regulator
MFESHPATVPIGTVEDQEATVDFVGDARHELLGHVVADVATNGIADRSLREIAASVGTSHRMLIYHFGSRVGLVAAIVGAVEESQRSLMSGATEVHDPTDVIRDVWERVSAPEVRPFVQLFFEAVAAASRTETGEFTSSWIDDVAAVTQALGLQHDPAEIRLSIAVIRGLLIDVINGTDPAVARASLERFLQMRTADRSISSSPLT